jgi:hypothetical protein
MIKHEFGVEDLASHFKAVFGNSKTGRKGRVVDLGDDGGEDFDREWSFEWGLVISAGVREREINDSQAWDYSSWAWVCSWAWVYSSLETIDRLS